MGLPTVPAPICAFTSSCFVSSGQAVGAQRVSLYMPQSLEHSECGPVWAEMEWVLLWLAEYAFPPVG